MLGQCVLIAGRQHHVIVELHSSSLLSSEQVLDDLASLLARNHPSTLVTKCRDLHSDLFHGFSISIRSRDELDGGPGAIVHTIRQHHAVRNAWTSTSTPGSFSGGRVQDWRRSDRWSAQRKTSVPEEVKAPPSHAQIAVDKLHAAGIRGKGIRIAILDTGFDYRQKPFGYHIGANKKIAYGHDWTGDRAMNILDPNDPYTECSHHGTHVLGIIAADSTHFGVVGAAPDATIELHRVFDCDDRNDEDTLFSALTAAWESGVDVINCSWGLCDTHESAISTLATRIIHSGTYVQFTAGNGGPQPFTIHTPGANPDVPAVGSVDCTSSAAYFWNGSYESDGMQYRIRWVPGLTNYTITEFPPRLEVWAPLEQVPEIPPWQPGTFPANLSVPDMDRAVLLIRLDFFAVCHQQIRDIIKPRYTLTYHPVSGDLGFPGMYFPAWPLSELPNTSALATVEHDTAVELVHEISKAKSVTITLAQKDAYSDEVVYAVNTRTGGRMTEKSSWGPTTWGGGGVTFAAPGGRILSTLPRLYGGFGQLTGTSMAAPLVSAVVALLKQLHPDWTPDMIRNVLATTARPLPYTDNSTRDYGFLAPVIQQGGGVIDAWSAAHTKIVVNVSALDFLDLNHRPTHLAFAVTNVANETISFNVAHIGAASGYAKLKPHDNFFPDDKNLEQSKMLMAMYAAVEIEPENLTLEAGMSTVVRVGVTPPPGLDPLRLPFYGGYIALNSTNGKQNLTVPYSGIAARLPEDLPLIKVTSVKSAMYHPDTGTWSDDIAVARFELVYLDGTVRFSSDAWPAIMFDKALLQPAKADVSIINADTGQAVKTHTLSGKDWSSEGWYWNGSDSHSGVVPAGLYSWTLPYLGLLATEEAELHTIIGTEHFSIEYGLGAQQYSYMLPDIEPTPCEIEAAEACRRRS